MNIDTRRKIFISTAACEVLLCAISIAMCAIIIQSIRTHQQLLSLQGIKAVFTLCTLTAGFILLRHVAVLYNVFPEIRPSLKNKSFVGFIGLNAILSVASLGLFIADIYYMTALSNQHQNMTMPMAITNIALLSVIIFIPVFIYTLRIINKLQHNYLKSKEKPNNDSNISVEDVQQQNGANEQER